LNRFLDILASDWGRRRQVCHRRAEGYVALLGVLDDLLCFVMEDLYNMLGEVLDCGLGGLEGDRHPVVQRLVPCSHVNVLESNI